MTTLAVIMSTYNGSKYIKEQVDSILSQSFKDFTLFIRDDGSTDNTVELLQELANADERIKLVFDDNENEHPNTNLGFGESFSRCAKEALKSDYKYFSFCDQDDFWEKEKLSLAVKHLDEMDVSSPNLFASNYYICDGELNITGNFCDGNPMDKVTFQNMFFEGVFPGFTIVINRTLAELAFMNSQASHIFYHDKWVSLIALGLKGSIKYCPTPLAKYRRHSEAASSTNLGFVKKLQWRINKVLNGDFCPRTKQMLISFKELFAGDVDADIFKFLKTFTGKSKLKKLFYKGRLRRSLSGEILLRLIILLGKI